MLKPITIDISEAISSLGISKEQMDSIKEEVLASLVSEYMYYWESQLKELKSTRNTYKEARYVNKIDRFTTIVGISPAYGPLPMMVEDGISAFDMKTGFENSSKAHHKEDGGWWLTIPFTHAAPTTKAADTFTSRMPEAIHQLAKKKAESGSTRGLTKGELPKVFQDTKKSLGTNIGAERIKAYQQKHPHYEGLVRTGKKNEEGYVTFRRVSDNSDENAWIHTGIEAHNLMDKALAAMGGDNGVADIAKNITQNIINNL